MLNFLNPQHYELIQRRLGIRIYLIQRNLLLIQQETKPKIRVLF